MFGGQEITYQSWYGIDVLTLESNRTYNPAGEIYDESGNLVSFYDNQVDNYSQEHYQFHWNERLNSVWNSAVGLNYTHGSGYYEEYNDLWFNQNISFAGNTSFQYLQLNPLKVGNASITDSENIRRNQQLAEWAKSKIFIKLIGSSHDRTHQEASFALKCSLKEAIEIGEQFNQRALFYIRGENLELVECSSGKSQGLGKFTERLEKL